MKRSMFVLGVMVLALTSLFQSCKKDELKDLKDSDSIQARSISSERGGDANYDRFGIDLEKAVDLSLEDPLFKTTLFLMTQERRQGDTEVLMTSFLATESERGESVRDILLENARELFTAQDLDAYLQSYPSLVIALRGDARTWIKGEYVAPTVFVPSDFDERSTTIQGTKNKKPVTIELNKKFKNAVIAMHLSERHDEMGNPMTTASRPGGSTTASGGRNSNSASGGRAVSCGGEPTECTNPIITDFDVAVVNGGISLSYEVDNFPVTLCSYGVIRITRIGPDLDGDGEADIKKFVRFANDPTFFYDNTAIPNNQYTYEIEVVIRYRNYRTDGSWVYCYAEEEFEETVIAPDILPQLASFRGENHSNTTLKYNWYPPAGIPVAQYRLRALVPNTNQYVDILGSPFDVSSNNFKFYDHPVSARGNLVEMLVQYRTSGGAWSGDYYDRSYASYRNPNQSLKWYAIHVPDEEVYEVSSVGESQIYGAPEVRLFAVQGAGTIDDRQTVPVQHRIIFTTDLCMTTEVIILPGVTITYYIPSGNYVDLSEEPVDIMNQWDNDLAGSAIKVVLTETDAAEVVVDGWSEESTRTINVKAELGVKLGFDLFGLVDAGVNFSLGVQATWKSAEKIDYKVPGGDLDIDIKTIYYHEPLLSVSNQNLFGLALDENGDERELSCELLDEEL